MNKNFRCRDCGAALIYITQYCTTCGSTGPHNHIGKKAARPSSDWTEHKSSGRGSREARKKTDEWFDYEAAPVSRRKLAVRDNTFADSPYGSDIESALATKSRRFNISESTRRYLTYGALGLVAIIIISLSADTIVSAIQKLSADLNLLATHQTSVKPSEGNGISSSSEPDNAATVNNGGENLSNQPSIAVTPSPEKPASNQQSPVIAPTAPIVDTVPPQLVGKPAVFTDESSATISWKTNEEARSQVQYGYTASYQFPSSETMQYSDTHSISINGLSSDTTYHYQIISIDAAGNKMTSADDYIFKTATHTDDAPYMGSRAPAFTLGTLDGRDISLNQFRGKKVILNFWASWCSPCKVEMPHLQAVWDKYKDTDDVMLLTVAGSQSDENVLRSYIDSNNFSIVVCLDSSESVFNRYELRSLPRTFFLDQNGIIRRIQQGMFTSPGEVEFMLNSY